MEPKAAGRAEKVEEDGFCGGGEGCLSGEDGRRRPEKEQLDG